MSRGWAGWGLFAALVLVGVNAVYGGIGLMVNGMGMPQDWLDRTPFDSWLLPGIALIVTVALPQFAAAWLVLRRAPRAATVGILVGAALMLWILVQVAILRRYFFLQPVIAGFGIVEVLLGLDWRRHLARQPAPAHRA
ncbi:MAG: hypothetical protein U0R80_10370 [Nocardioidaceae bacterium]